ncbi:DUF881 domain-containing protein [Actinoallomurus iriomotensis]|uniref:Membrane protein n=1 Tax=Actinoallomurus iriomotensis TaxID=478107 RepID=A0A9W6S4Y3_9ACTN|nr:DUF881 domain-containing protein [Actinoallomurus iriomotensis]GLY87223.1 membrane protein [Actinoallomurus iriomotensis]
MSEPGVKRRWDRPDASMSLLADLLSGSGLDPGYEEAAARRAATGGAGRSGRAGRASRLLAATLLLGLLGAMAVIQVRRGAPVAERQRDALIAQIRQRTDETASLQRQAEALQRQTESLRRSALASSDAGQNARQSLDRAAGQAAAAPVTGSAAVVTVDDSHSARGATAQQDGHIYDQDLQRLVNGLWAAGATAIAINGQRMTATTAIRSAGDAILVDYQPLSPPYVVTALGDGLDKTFAGSAAGRAFRTLKATFGIRFDIRQEDDVRLPAAPAPRLRYAQPEETPK